MIDESEVISKFKEWHLSAALAQQAKHTQDLWHLPVVRPVPGDASLVTLAQMFAPSEPDGQTECDEPFTLQDAARYGFPDEVFRKNYWGLRPDFRIHGKDLLVLLEAKGPGTPAKTWTDPKESTYYRFLDQCSVSRKGFVYVVPRSAEASCLKCIQKHFASAPGIQVGRVHWEDLFKFIEPTLLEVAIDELMHVSEGLRRLRNWQIEQRA